MNDSIVMEVPGTLTESSSLEKLIVDIQPYHTVGLNAEMVSVSMVIGKSNVESIWLRRDLR